VAQAAQSGPVTQLAPGYVTLARVQTPQQGTVTIFILRIRYLGKVALCVRQTPHGQLLHGGSASCAHYPVGSNVSLEANGTFWETFGVAGCKPHPPPRIVWGLWSAVVLRPGLTAWLRTPSGDVRIPEVPVPNAFHVTGPLIYAVLTKPSTIVLRTSNGHTVGTTSVVPEGACSFRNAAPFR